MGRFLLDTQIFLWWLSDAPQLKENTRKIIANPRNLIYISAVTSWEIAIKKALGKVKAPGNISEIVQEEGFLKLPIQLYHGDMIFDLPPIHRDPFDRMLIAQALSEDLTIITADRKLTMYEARTILN